MQTAASSAASLRISRWPAVARMTGSRSWLFSADLLPALAAACLPWSTSAVSAIWPIWLIVAIPIIDYRAFLGLLRKPACWLPLALVALALVGLLWADGPWRDRLSGLGPVTKFLVFPVLLYHFAHSKRAAWVLWAFLGSCALLELFSWIVIFEPQLRMTHADVAVTGVPIKNSIDQSYELALCLFVLAPIALKLFEQRRLWAFLGLAAFGLALFVTLTFVVTARTAVVYIPIVALIFVVRHLGIKAAAVLLATAAVLAPAVWLASPYLRNRIEAVGHEYTEYRDEHVATSTGMRLAWWRESAGFVAAAPILGHGTGSTKELMNRNGSERLFSAGMIKNPHNQILYVAIQWGIVGCIVLFAIWGAHLMLFRSLDVASWIGFAVVTQNILSSLFNSHLFDFTEGWIYVLGVATAGGVVLARRQNNGARSPPAEV